MDVRPFLLVLALAGAAACDDEPAGPGTEPEGGFSGAWTAVAAGANHACGLDGNGRAFCWGAGARGQLGDGSPAGSPVPVPVLGGFRFSSLDAAGDRTCGIALDGRTLCWGRNDLGQLGDGDPFDLPVPTPVLGDPGLESLSLGPLLGCGLDARGAVHCWGGARFDAAFGGEPPDRCVLDFGPPVWPCSRRPLALFPELRFREVSVGVYHACGTLSRGAVVCWGEDLYQQLGVPTGETCTNQLTFSCSRRPLVVTDAGPLTDVWAGGSHSCGLAPSGQAWCWGAVPLDFGQLGTGDQDGAPEPRAVLGGHRFDSLAVASENHVHTFTCGLTAEGEALCWGTNTHGQLGTATPETCNTLPCSTVPVRVETSEPLTATRLGDRFACALTRDGTVLCWGRNEAGQLGDGTTQDRAEPRPVAPPAAAG